MVDWKGFLKWSLTYNDGTKETEIPKLTSEQSQFLEEAMKSFSFDEVKRMKEILLIFEAEISDQ